MSKNVILVLAVVFGFFMVIEPVAAPSHPETINRSITIVSPNGSERFSAGQQVDIRWTSSNLAYNEVNIALLSGGEIIWPLLFERTADDGNESWTVPFNLTPRDDYKIQVFCPPISGVQTCDDDQSDAAFSIVAANISVLSPNGGEVWEKRSRQVIRWSAPSSIREVDIILKSRPCSRTVCPRFPPPVFYRIANGTENDGIFEWTVPENIPGEVRGYENTYLIEISNLRESDQSNSLFSIVAANTTANCFIKVNGTVVKSVYAADRQDCYDRTSFGSRNCDVYSPFFAEGSNLLEQYFNTDRVNNEICIHARNYTNLYPSGVRAFDSYFLVDVCNNGNSIPSPYSVSIVVEANGISSKPPQGYGYMSSDQFPGPRRCGFARYEYSGFNVSKGAQYLVNVTVDPTGEVSESDETDNQIISEMFVHDTKTVHIGEPFVLSAGESANIRDVGVTVYLNQVYSKCDSTEKSEKLCLFFGISTERTGGKLTESRPIAAGGSLSFPELGIKIILLGVDGKNAKLLAEKYQAVDQKVRLSFYTDKSRYELNEPVRIITNAFGSDVTLDIEKLELVAVIKRPDGKQDRIKLPRSYEAQKGKEIETKPIGINPAYWRNAVFYGVYDRTDIAGKYLVSIESNLDVNMKQTSATFDVSDNTLLSKYLILEDIDGYKFTGADFNQDDIGDLRPNVYTAGYRSSDSSVEMHVADFSSREEAEKGIELLKKQVGNGVWREEKAGESTILVLSDAQNSTNYVLWTHSNFVLAMPGQRYFLKEPVYQPQIIEPTAAKAEQLIAGEKPIYQPEAGETSADKAAQAARTSYDPCEWRPGKDYGLCKAILGVYYDGSRCVHLGGCSLRGDVTPFTGLEQCESACRFVASRNPLIVVHAYLEKYPSDLGKKEEKKEISSEELLEVGFKLENLKKKFDELQRNAIALSQYYTSVGDTESAGRFDRVAGMFAEAKGKIEEIKTKIRNSIDSPDRISEDIKEDVKELRTFMRKIFIVLLGGGETEAKSSLFGG